MPKKSKREKIIADMRRAVPAVFREITPSENTQELTLIKRDLTKTVLFAAIAIGVEIILYWRM